MTFKTWTLIFFFLYILLTVIVLILRRELKKYFITSIIIFSLGILTLNIFSPEGIPDELLNDAYESGYSEGVDYGKEHYSADSARLKGIEDAFEDSKKESYYDVGYSDGQCDRVDGFKPSIDK